MKKSNLIKIKDYADRSYNLAISRRRKGDFLSALTILKGLAKKGGNADVYADVARVYLDMDMIPQSAGYWFKYLNSCSKSSRALAYHGLGTCFYLAGRYELAGYYYEKQLELAEDTEFEYMETLYDYYEELSEMSSAPDFHIAYPPEKMNADDVIAEAERFIFEGRNEDAVATLEQVKEDSEAYIGAQLRIAAYWLFENDNEKAENILNGLIDRFPDDDLVKINMICYLAAEGKKEQSLAIFKTFDDAKITDFAQSFKLATAFYDMGEDKISQKYAKLALEQDAYSPSALYLYALTKYNLNEFDEASEIFYKVYKLIGDPVAKFMGRLADDGVEPELFERLSYERRLPNFAMEDWVKNVTQIVTGTISVKKENLPLIFEMCDWVFSFPTAMQSKLAEVLIGSKNAKIRDYFLDVLLSQTVYDTTKSAIITALMNAGCKNKIGVVSSFLYKKINLPSLDDFSSTGKEKVLKRAYSLSFGKLCLNFKRSLSPLKDAAYYFLETLNKNGNVKKLNDENALAGALVCYADILTLKKKQIAELFSTTTRKINEQLKLLNDDETC